MAAVGLLLIRGFRQNFTKYSKGFPMFNSSQRFNSTITNYQSIADFYNGKSVFITGGTGFLGKVFIERLLDSCAELDKVYILLRKKKYSDINTRLQQILGSSLFTRLKECNPTFIDKLIPINGDITLPNLGISLEDEKTLIEKISVVIHSAATIMLKDPFTDFININVEGTLKVLDLCKRMKTIQAFVYVSTAYAHTQHPVLSEKVYPAPAKLKDVYKFIEKYGENKEEIRRFISDSPNIYAFSKALAESYVAENHEHVPTIIIRPSLVTPTIKEPFNGWLDNWFGATRVLYHTSKGWNRITYGKGHYIVDFIPIDYVANLTIIAATRAHRSNEVQVYHSTSSSQNPVTWHDVNTYIFEESVKKGYNQKSFNYMLYSESRIMVKLMTLILQTIPSYIADFWLKVRGKPPMHVTNMSQVVNVRDSVDYYTSHCWIMKADRSQELFSQLSKEDQKKFPCNPVDIKWSRYMKDYVNGIYQHLKPEHNEQNRKKSIFVKHD